MEAAILLPIAIDKPDMRLQRFNAKIEAYNQALSSQDKGQAIQLLHELYFFQQELTNLARTNLFQANQTDSYLSIIFNWRGIQEELASLNPKQIRPLPGLATEKSFDELSSPDLPVDTVAHWKQQMEPSVISFAYTLFGMSLSHKVRFYIKNLLNSHESHGNSLEYYYHLQAIKKELFSAINFENLSESELVDYRTLLRQIGAELVNEIKKQENLSARYQQHADISYELRDGLQALSAEDKEKLIEIYRFPIDYKTTSNFQTNPLTKNLSEAEIHDYQIRFNQTITTKLPSLNSYVSTRLPGANNTTWLLQKDETAESVVLRIEHPVPATLMDSLRVSPLNEFLAQTYTYCSVTEDAFYSIVISEYAAEGDLRSYCSNQEVFPTVESRIEQAVTHLGFMTSFCNLLLKNKVINTDLKLSNFLINSEGGIFMNDMKAFKQLTHSGKVSLKEVLYSPAYD